MADCRECNNREWICKIERQIKKMALVNKDGIQVAYVCEDLIEELKEDLLEFGDEDVYVLTEQRDGVKLYRDYNFMELEPEYDDEEDEWDEPGPGFGALAKNESVDILKMSELLKKYREQNEVVNDMKHSPVIIDKDGKVSIQGIVYFHDEE